MNKKVYLVITVGVLLRLYFMVSAHYISPDGTQYVSLGYNLWHHGAYTSNGSQFPDIIQPPLYPLLSGFFTLFLPAELAGKIMSLLCGIVLIIAVFRFAGYLKLPGSVALGSAWIAALHPALVAVSSQAVTEALYLLLLFYGIVYGWRVYRQPTKQRAAALSLIWLLVFLTRPEGLFFFIFHLLLAFVLLVRGKLRWTQVAALIFPFVAGSLLYGVIVSSEVGHFTISPKLSYIRAQVRMARFVKKYPPPVDQAIIKAAKDDPFKFALNKDKNRLAVDEIFYGAERDKGLQNRPQIPVKRSLLKLAQALAAHLVVNIRLSVSKLIFGLSFPLIYLLLLMVGLLKWPRQKRELLIYALIMALPVFNFLISHVEDRFLYGLVVLSVLPMGAGLAELGAASFMQKLSATPKGLHSVRGSLLPVLLVLLFSFPSYRSLAQKMQAKAYYFQAGQWLRQEIPPLAKVAASKPQALFFAQRNYIVYPFASIDDLLLYLKSNEVDYLLLEDRDFYIRPGVAQLLTRGQGVRLLKEINVSGHHFYLLFVG